MKSLSVIASLVVALVAVRICAAQQLITPEQAQAAVRAFEGYANLQFESVTYDEETPEGPEWNHLRWYDISGIGPPETQHSWMVNAVTGEVFGANYSDAGPDTRSEDPLGPLTQEQCLEIAESLARAKYAGFDQMNFELGTQDWHGLGWQFEWNEKLQYGAETPNSVTVRVSPIDGRIEDYGSCRVTMPTPPEPQITAEQAVDTAKQATGIVTVNYVDGPTLTADPDGIYWSFEIDGQDAQGIHQNYVGWVNAVTGEAGEMYPAFGAEVEPEGSAPASLPVRELLAKKGYAIHWNPAKKQLRAARGLKDVIVLQVGSKVATINGKPVTLDHAPKIVDGRMLVPATIVKLLP